MGVDSGGCENAEKRIIHEGGVFQRKYDGSVTGGRRSIFPTFQCDVIYGWPLIPMFGHLHILSISQTRY